MRRDEPIAIFLRTSADGTRRAIAIGQQTGTFVSADGWLTYSALLDHLAKLITAPSTEPQQDHRIRLMAGDVP